jgi:hypothetical protein
LPPAALEDRQLGRDQKTGKYPQQDEEEQCQIAPLALSFAVVRWGLSCHVLVAVCCNLCYSLAKVAVTWPASAHSQNNSAIVPECKLQLASERSLKAALRLEPLPD